MFEFEFEFFPIAKNGDESDNENTSIHSEPAPFILLFTLLFIFYNL